jgi:hypothetical protein
MLRAAPIGPVRSGPARTAVKSYCTFTVQTCRLSEGTKCLVPQFQDPKVARIISSPGSCPKFYHIVGECGPSVRPWGGTANTVIYKWRRCEMFCGLQNKASGTSSNTTVDGQSSSQKLVMNEHTSTSRKVLLLSGGVLREEQLLVIRTVD